MTAFDLEIVQGDSRTATITVIDPSTNLPFNLTGKRLIFTAKAHQYGAVAFVKSSPGAGITITNAAGGLASMALDSADTLNYADTTILQCSLHMDNNPGNSVALAMGTLRVIAEIQ
jgi:hypothetical protein